MRPLHYIFLAAILALTFNLSSLSAQTGFWQRLEKPYGGGIFFFAIAPSGEIIVGTESLGTFRSTDNGLTWNRLGTASSLLVMAVDAQKRLFALNNDRGGIFRSTDDGGTWLRKSAGLEGRQPRYLVMKANGELFVATDSGVYRSTDGAESWSAAGLSGIGAEVLSVSPTGVLFAISQDALYRSEDDGATWTRSGEGVWTEEIGGITFGPTGDLFILAKNTIYKSVNGGIDFTAELILELDNRFAGLVINAQGEFFTMVRDLGVLRVAGSSGSITYTLLNQVQSDVMSIALAPNGNVLVGHGSRGIYVSQDNGDSWQHAGLPYGARITALAEIRGALYAAVPFGMNRSTDGGATWTEVDVPAYRIATIDTTPSGVMIAGADLGNAFRSTNGGATWTPMTIDISTSVFDVLVTKNGAILLASFEGMIRSSNDGVSWAPVIPDKSVNAIAQTPNGDLWAAGFVRVYHSTDDGLTWTEKIVPGADNALHSLAVLPDSSLLMGGDSITLRSTDNGATWVPYDLGCTDGDFRVHAGADGATYLATSCGIYRFASGGITTTKVADWPDDRSQDAFMVSSGRILYAGGESGFYRSTSTLGVERPEAPASAGLRLHAAPSPSRGDVAITFSLPKGGHATLSVHSIRGDEEITLLDGYLPAGEHVVEWKTAGAPSGAYIYRLRSGDGVGVGKIELVR